MSTETAFCMKLNTSSPGILLTLAINIIQSAKLTHENTKTQKNTKIYTMKTHLHKKWNIQTTLLNLKRLNKLFNRKTISFKSHE